VVLDLDRGDGTFSYDILLTPDIGEAFVIFRPTGQIIWALADGKGQDAINLQIGNETFDLTG